VTTIGADYSYAMPCNDRALAYWNERNYSAADIRPVMIELEAQNLMAVALEFKENANMHCVLTQKYGERYQTEGHLPAIVRIFSSIHKRTGGNTYRGWIVVWAEDQIWGEFPKYSERVPLFAFGRGVNDGVTFLMPDPPFIMTEGYAKERDEIAETWREYPWDRKLATVFWRGASSGYGFELDIWREVQRMRLCLKSKEIGDLSRMDAAFSKLVPFSKPEFEKRILDLDVVRGPVPFRDFLKYRYQIDIDGFANAWTSCFLKLASHCLTLKVASDSMQWYYDRLRAWENYIPLGQDLADFDSVHAWLAKNDSQAQTIAENAFKVMESITLEGATADLAQTLGEVLSRQNG